MLDKQRLNNLFYIFTQMEKENLSKLMDYLHKLDKSELKNEINKHGWFTKFKVNIFDWKQNNIPKKNVDQVPTWALYFEGVASDGSLNLNGYKIDPNAWTPAINEYMTNFGWKIYLQHDMDQVIGNTLSAKVDDWKLLVTWYVYDDLTSNRIWRNLTTDLSTWHYQLDYVMEDEENGDRISKEDFREVYAKIVKSASKEADTYEEFVDIIDNALSRYTKIVTELLFVEYSFVTVGANLNAKATTIESNSPFKELGYDSEDDMKDELKATFLSYKKDLKLNTNNNDWTTSTWWDESVSQQEEETTQEEASTENNSVWAWDELDADNDADQEGQEDDVSDDEQEIEEEEIKEEQEEQQEKEEDEGDEAMNDDINNNDVDSEDSEKVGETPANDIESEESEKEGATPEDNNVNYVKELEKALKASNQMQEKSNEKIADLIDDNKCLQASLDKMRAFIIDTRVMYQKDTDKSDNVYGVLNKEALVNARWF